MAVRARNLRPGDSVEQYIKDFRLALLGFLRNEPHPEVIQPEAAMLANAANVEQPIRASTAGTSAGTSDGQPGEPSQDVGAQAKDVVDSLKPLSDLMHEIAKTFGGHDPSKN